MGRPSRFSPEVRERGIRLVDEQPQRTGRSSAPCARWPRSWAQRRDAPQVSAPGGARRRTTAGPDGDRARAGFFRAVCWGLAQNEGCAEGNERRTLSVVT